jgi:large subunit ribosomal protein L3
MKGLLGKKVGMTQIFDESGAAVPVTLIEAGPCYVTHIRRPKGDGYAAVQLGFEEAKPRRLTGGQLGHLNRHELPPLRYLREFRVKQLDEIKEGEQVTVDLFTIGDRVDVVGTSKGLTASERPVHMVPLRPQVVCLRDREVLVTWDRSG